MQIDFVNQVFGTNDFGARLKVNLADPTVCRFRALVAFVKRYGLAYLEPESTSFLTRGGTMEWIVGLDCGGTSPEALEYLLGLSRSYRPRVNVRYFSAGSQHHVFHPKIYMLDSANELTAWVGSSNTTGGGMFLNCECMVQLKINKNVDLTEARLLEALWDSYSRPSPYLRRVTDGVIQKLVERYGPEQPGESYNPPRHPIRRTRSHLPSLPRLPRLNRNYRPSTQPPLRPRARELIMEILQETRDTQVQIPTEVLAKYFGLRSDEIAQIRLRYKENNLTRSIKNRNIVHHRGMHRVELETISGLRRPVIAVFHRDPRRRDTYDYELLKNGTSEYKRERRLLQNRGHQTTATSRLWLTR
jgi:HKD family nuclease